MNKLALLTSSTLLLISACGNNVEKLAQEKLTEARTAYEKGNLLEAKQQIDSIKILYPKAFDTRKAAQEFMLDVELKIQEKKLDSLSTCNTNIIKHFEEIKSNFKLEKDTAYQKVGYYLWPTQTIENNLHRSFLRFQVNEKGIMSMTSIYCGKTNIHHFQIKVSTSDGKSIETPHSKDVYETSDMDEKIEKADFKLGDDGGVIEFICNHSEQNIRVEFIGDRTFNTNLLPTDRKAASQVYQLAKILSSLTQNQMEEEAANLKIKYIQKKKELNATKSSSEE